jgi:hypothetical protein
LRRTERQTHLDRKGNVMGVTDAGILTQLRKGQGETNDRLDLLNDIEQHLRKLAAGQERTNQLLEWLGTLLQQRPQT